MNLQREEVDIEALLEKNLKLTKENNRLLKKMHRAHLMGVIMRIIFVLLLIGVPYLIYQYYLEEYVLELQEAYQSMQEDVRDLKELPSKVVPDAISERFQ